MPRVYAIASAKGGVGKTTTTVNLGATLAGTGADVVVIDGDIGMANLGAALGVRPHGATLHDALSGSVEPVAAAYEGSGGLTVVPGDTSLEAFSAADPQRLQGVVEAFDDADFILIDVGAGISHETSVPLSVADSVLLVSTAERDALVDTEKTRQLTERLGGVVAGAVITRTDAATPIEEIVSGTLSAKILATIPEDEAVRESIAVGEPLLSYAPDSEAATAYRRLVTELTGIELTSPAERSAVDTATETEPTTDAVEAVDAGDRVDETDSESGSETGSAPDSETDSASDPETAVAIDAAGDNSESDPTDAPTAEQPAASAGEDSEKSGDGKNSQDSDEAHNVVNPFAATPKDDAVSAAQPEEAESKWAEAATGTTADSDGISIDPASGNVPSETVDADSDDVQIDSAPEDEPEDKDDTESVPQDAIPFGSTPADDEDSAPDSATEQTTVLGAEVDDASDGETERAADSEMDAADGPLIPDAEETAAANASEETDDEVTEADDADATDDDNEEKRGFFSRLFR